jgi:hypothetical protein
MGKGGGRKCLAYFNPGKKIDVGWACRYTGPMNKPSRRQALQDYKERKIAQGVFAVRCVPTGEVWTGISRNLGQQQNGVWFALKLGSHPNRALQAAWAAHGEAAFGFQALETVEAEDLSDYALANRLKEREAHWRATLNARKVVG